MSPGRAAHPQHPSRSARSRGSRIILGLDAGARTAIATDVVRCILPADVSELQSVFVADAGLLEHARSRLAREVLTSGITRKLDTEIVRRQMRVLSTLARHELDRAAARLGLQHSFRVAHDEVPGELVTRAHEADTLVVTLSGAFGLGPGLRATIDRLVVARLHILMFARETWEREHSIALLVDPDDDVGLAPRVAQQLAEQSGSALLLIARGTRDEAQAMRDALADTGMKLAEEALSAPSTDAVIDAARRSRARAVVMPWHHEPEEAALVERLLTETPATVALVGD
jgi:hypothetical protein